MRSSFVIAALALLLPGIVHGGEYDELVLLQGDVTFEVTDSRASDERGDGNLGWYKVQTSGWGTYDLRAEGPGTFSLKHTIGDVFTGAADEFGLLVTPGRQGGQPHVTLEVEDFWCDNSLDWTSCHARLKGRLALGDGAVEWFMVEDAVDGDVDDLKPVLQELLLLELTGLPSASDLKAQPPFEEAPILRYGWLTRLDESAVHGVVADDPEGGVCVVRNGTATPVALEDIAAVDAKDVHLPGIRVGDDWLVAGYGAGRFVAGAVVQRKHGGDATWLRTRKGVYAIPVDTTADVARGRWTARAPVCEDSPKQVSASSSGGSRWETYEPESSRWDEKKEPRWDDRGDTGLVLVDGAGDPVDVGPDYWDDRLYALEARNAGSRRWKRYRLSWQAFADKTGDPLVQDAIDEYVYGQKQRAHVARALLWGGIATAIGSGVALGAFTAASLNNTNLLLDPASPAVYGLLVGGVWTGVGFGIGGQIGLFVAGRRMKGAHRYENLLMILDAEEALRAVKRAEGRSASDEGLDDD